MEVRHRGCFVIAVVPLLVIGIGGGYLLGSGTGSRRNRTSEVRETSSVVVAVRRLARLQTAEYRIERVIDLSDRQSQLFGLLEARDAILLVASGVVSAGVDLSKLSESRLKVDPQQKSVVLELEPPQIFDSHLDNQRTYVHARHTDLLARREINLESRARKEAQGRLRQAAYRGGILKQARVQAEYVLRALFRSLGFQQVKIRWSAA